MTASFQNSPSSDDNAFLNFLNTYKNVLGYAGLAVLLIIGGSWYIMRSNTLKEERAAQQYQAAMQSVMSGNIPLAQTDLQRMIVRYRGTMAGTSGALTLAKLFYDEGKYQEGIDALGSIKASSETGHDIHMLAAAGYEGLGDFDKAAAEYREAAKAARFEADKDAAKAAEARAYMSADKKEEAISIWQEIADNPKSRNQLEAKLRLGELQAAPIGS